MNWAQKEWKLSWHNEEPVPAGEFQINKYYQQGLVFHLFSSR